MPPYFQFKNIFIPFKFQTFQANFKVVGLSPGCAQTWVLFGAKSINCQPTIKPLELLGKIFLYNTKPKQKEASKKQSFNKKPSFQANKKDFQPVKAC